MKKIVFGTLLTILLTYFCALAIAKADDQMPEKVPEFLFGPEFTFGVNSRGDMLDDYEKIRELFLKRASQHLIRQQPAGAKFTTDIVRSEYRGTANKFTSPNDWWFTLDKNPGVVEVQMKPMTVDEYKKHADDIQDALFATASNMNLFPGLYVGGGHINIGLWKFENNPLLLRNFLIDFYNHNELYFGILNFNISQASPPDLNWNAPSTANRFLEYIESFDFKACVRRHHKKCLQQFLDRLPMAGLALRLQDHRPLGVSSRLEIRAVRPQYNIHIWIKQIELLQKRFEYLATFKKPIPYKPALQIPRMSDEDLKNQEPPVDPQEAMKSFYKYVTESGLKWQDHREYIWPAWVFDGELKKFEQSDWFQQQNSCGGLLGATQ